MKTYDFSEKNLTRAVRLALLAMFVVPGLAIAQSDPDQKAVDPKAVNQRTDQAADDEDEEDGDVKALICPTNYFEVGALNVSSASPKFGEYNGLNGSGLYGVGNFSVSGGSGYCRHGGALRWQVSGKDLGTTSRNIGGSVGEQGRWSVGLNFDQLRHYTTTGYQTPYQGSRGDNVFGLSPGFGTIANGTVNGINTTALTPAQLAVMRTVNVYNERRNTSFNAGYNFNTEWGVKFNYKRIDMSGAKLVSGYTEPADLTALGGFNYSGGRVMLMNPTKSSTDMFTLALNWTGKNAYASFEYYASLYHDDYNGLSFSNPFSNQPAGTVPGSLFPLSTMSTPPSNNLHQINLTGGYIFSPATKLTGGLSFSINRQNASYDGTYTPGSAPGLSVSSLGGKVENKHADLRLTHQFMPALNLNVGYKYNERDNQTSSRAYTFIDLAGGNDTVVNIPMSHKRQQFDAALAYRIDKRQRLNFGYEYEQINRWCNNALANTAQGANAAYYTTASCAQVPKSTENRFSLGYKLSVLDQVNFNAGYTYSDRDATVNPSFYNPMQAIAQGYENYGWLAFFQASRRQNLLKAGVNWQVTPKFSLGLNGRYTKDNYYDSALGVQSGKSSSVNLDADYAFSENASFGAYVSWQDRSRDLTSASDRSTTALPVNLWFNTLTDRDTAIGINGKQKLFHGKLQLTEDLSYGLGKSSYNTTLGPNIAPAVGNNGSTPDIKSELIQFRLTGAYDLNKHSRVTAGWLYQRLKANDYYYNGYQYGFAPTAMLPTNQKGPGYTVNVVYLLYRYSF